MTMMKKGWREEVVPAPGIQLHQAWRNCLKFNILKSMKLSLFWFTAARHRAAYLLNIMDVRSS